MEGVKSVEGSPEAKSVDVEWEDPASLDKIKETLEEIIAAEKLILSDPAPLVAVSELAASSVNLVVRPWVKTEDYLSVYFKLTEQIKLVFDEKNISFPYPQQDVHMHQVSE